LLWKQITSCFAIRFDCRLCINFYLQVVDYSYYIDLFTFTLPIPHWNHFIKINNKIHFKEYGIQNSTFRCFVNNWFFWKAYNFWNCMTLMFCASSVSSVNFLSSYIKKFSDGTGVILLTLRCWIFTTIPEYAFCIK